MSDHLEIAQKSIKAAHEAMNQPTSEAKHIVAKSAALIAQAEALIDIAESLQAIRWNGIPGYRHD